MGAVIRNFMQRMKRPALYCVVLHIIEWAVFIFCDFMDESHGGGDSAIAAAFLMPGVSAVVLCLLVHVLSPESGYRKKWQYTLALAAVWFIVTGLSLIAELILMDRGCMPVKQNQSGWENFLNGIEYVFFPIWNLIIGCGVLLLSILVRAGFRKIKAYRAAKQNG